MKKLKLISLLASLFIIQTASSQLYSKFVKDFSIFSSYHQKVAEVYNDKNGNPYLNKEFSDGIVFINDTNLINVPLRYNIYKDEIEYRHENINYILSKQQVIKKIVFGDKTFVYIPYFNNGGYFEQIVKGKCQLLKKYEVKLESEQVNLIAGTVKPETLSRKSDVYYFALNDSITYKIWNLQSVIKTFENENVEIKTFLKEKKIKNIKPENLIKIVEYYNSIK